MYACSHEGEVGRGGQKCTAATGREPTQTADGRGNGDQLRWLGGPYAGRLQEHGSKN